MIRDRVRESQFPLSSSMRSPLFYRYTFGYYFFFLFLVSVYVPSAKSSDAEALLALKSSIDPSNSLQWRGTDACQWQGIRECMKGRVTKLVLERLNLTGTLDERSLNQLDQLRVLSFKQNSISGQIPNLSGLANLKSLFLNDNDFSGHFPDSLTTLHRLKIIVLFGNRLSGDIPDSLLRLPRLYVLYLQDNRFTGTIPPLNQTSLRFFNVSNNQLAGEIPATPALSRFNLSSFSGNNDLCGEQVHSPCSETGIIPSPSPSSPILPSGKSNRRRRNWKLIAIIAGSVGGFLVISIILLVFCMRKRKTSTGERREVTDKGAEEREEGTSGDGNGGNNGRKQGGFSWEGGGSGGGGGDGLGSLVFVGPDNESQMSYSLEDLLKASAETLGRGSVGSTYKAMMESGFIVTVKRLREARYPRIEDFRRQMEALGRLRHPNLVPIRAYFQAKEERLLVYDYFPNGSLFSLIHGSRGSGGGKPLHWTSCLKIAEDLATGLVYIHQNPALLTHGNLKSSNVLLGSDFESCLTDYGLNPFKNPDSTDEPTASSLFYRAPEARDPRNLPTQQSDVYSFGVLLLELLTGKTPFQDLVQEHGSDIPMWVKSVREEETESGEDPASSGNEAAEEKLGTLLNVAVMCVSMSPENRPTIREVLRMIRETRAEAQVSSNSSDHSPGRWSDTVQSLPRDEHLSI